MPTKSYRHLIREDADKVLDQEYASGIEIAKKHITPFLLGLDKYKYGRIELASALLVLAYNILRKNKPEKQARIYLRILVEKSIDFVESKEKRKLH